MSDKIRFELLRRNKDLSWTLDTETRTFEEAEALAAEITKEDTDRIQIHKVETTYVKIIKRWKWGDK